MKKPFTIEEVKKMYFAQFDEIAWYIAHDKFKMNAIRRCLKENEKCYLGNLLETTKRYFSGSLRDFQKCEINTVEIKKEWEKVIDEIQKEIINNSEQERKELNMTVKELISELKKCTPDPNVAVVTDWESCDENGNLPTETIIGVHEQIYVDTQFGDNEEREIIMLL